MDPPLSARKTGRAKTQQFRMLGHKMRYGGPLAKNRYYIYDHRRKGKADRRDGLTGDRTLLLTDMSSHI